MFLKLQLRYWERKTTRLFTRIEKFRKLALRVTEEPQLHLEVRNEISRLLTEFDNAAYEAKVLRARIERARMKREIKGRLKK